MRENYVPPAALRKLLDALLADGYLSREDTARLEQYLEEPAALRYYNEIAMQEALLPQVLESAGAELVRAESGAVKWMGRLAGMVPRLAGAAALLAIGLLLGFALPFGGRNQSGEGAVSGASEPGKAQEQVVHARITGMLGIRWSRDSASDGGVLHDFSKSDRLVFESGLVELSYDNGVRVMLEGPADYRITGRETGQLEYGKLVAMVPKGAEGFVVNYPGGHILDLGTEFAVDLDRQGDMKLGVFDGEVVLNLANEEPLSLVRDQAVEFNTARTGALVEVPFDRERFVRNFPSRDFRWLINQSQPQQVYFDVSHLIWKPGQYHAVFKWIEGLDAVEIRDVELRRNGEPVARTTHQGICGHLRYTHNNQFALLIEPGELERGARWEVVATLSPHPRYRNLKDVSIAEVPLQSQGIMQFEEGLIENATAADFIGKWGYHHAGHRFVREFHADGTISLWLNGVPQNEYFAGCRWFVEDGILYATQPKNSLLEGHALRDRSTLLFTNRPYHNARRVESESSATPDSKSSSSL